MDISALCDTFVSVRRASTLCRLLVLTTLLLSGCRSIPLPKSQSAPVANSDAVCALAHNTQSNADQTIDCARAMSYSLEYTANKLADQRQHFRHGEIAISALSLGLAGFEADVDTLKATGLALGTTSAFQGSRQYTNRISAAVDGSRRMLCIVENGRKAQEAQRKVDGLSQRIQVRTTSALSRMKVKSAALSTEQKTLVSMFSTDSYDKRLRDAVLDAIAQVESAADRKYRYSEATESAGDVISKSIKDAIALGASKESVEKEVLRSALVGRDAVLADLARAAAEGKTDFEAAVIELSTCKSI